MADLETQSDTGLPVLQRLGKCSYRAHIRGYSSLLYSGDHGVLLFDPMSGDRISELLTVIRSVTSQPVTGIVYSHSHLDHIGDAAEAVAMIQATGVQPRIYATQMTLYVINRFLLDVHRPDVVINVPDGEFRFENLLVKVFTPEYFAHSWDSSVFYLPSERVINGIDGINPDYLP